MDLSVPSPNRHYRALPVQSGRFLQPGDRHKAVIGASFAASRHLTPGAQLELEGQSYEVVGVLERMLTAPDRFVIVSIEDAREQWVSKDRLLRTILASGGVALRAQDLNTGAAVGWRDGEDPDAVARRIHDQVAGVNVQIPSELSSLLRQSTAFFSALLVGLGLLAFVIGGLSLANTVAAAVFERIRDFGVKRALGATDWHLGREILGEALAVTLSGGALGVLLAIGLGLGIDGWVRRSGQQLFLFSPRLLGGALIFSVLLGAAAAAYAALRIVRLSPADAIRRGSAA
jgi:putative ABC transport system permease protein